MTTIRIKGVKSYESKGTRYYYLRKTGKPIADAMTGVLLNPETDLAAFGARVDEMKAELEALPAATPEKPGDLEALIVHWRGNPGKNGSIMREPSPEWLQLKGPTRISYERVINPETGYIRKALKRELTKVPLHLIGTPFVVKLRNKVNRISGYWFANYTVKVLRTMFKWAKLYGHMTHNPAKDVPELKRPEDMPDQHRSWAEGEYAAMFDAAVKKGWEGVAKGLGLARWAGWTLGDICNQPPSAWQDPRLAFIRRKTRSMKRLTDMRAPAPLIAILRDLKPDMNAPTLVTNEQGNRYTESGFGSMVWKLGKELVKEGKVKPGLTIHGLRHSLGKQLYDLGLEREQRKAMMSHQSDQASMVYERDGNRSVHADAAVVKLDRSLRKGATKGKPKR